jgi:hypothetical protein
MRKTNAIAALLITIAVILIGIVSLPRKPRLAAAAHRGPGTTAQRGAETASSLPSAVRAGPDRVSRQKALRERFSLSLRRLDSLERDSLRNRSSDSAVYARMLRTVRTRRDHTQYALDLLGYTDTTDPAAWEVARARAQDSLDSLELYLRFAKDGVLRPEPPAPSSSSAPKEAARTDSD